MIIQTEQLFKWMDDHNINAVTREQLGQFAHEPNPDGDFGRGVIHGLKYVMNQIQSNLTMWETATLAACATCRHLQPDVDVCCCEQSEKYAKFVDRMMTCERWQANAISTNDIHQE